jgi:subtilisin family serine protease
MPSNKATSKRTSRHRTTRGRIGRRGLRLEFLEDRRLLSADGLTAPHLAPSLDWRLDAGGDELAAVYDVSDASDALLHLPVLLGEDNDGPQFVPGEVLIGFDGHWKALHRGRGSEAALEIKAELFSSMGLSHPNMLVPFQESGPGNRPIETRWQFPADTDVQQMVQSLANIPGVTYAEPNYLVSIGSIPNDSRFDTLWGLHNTGQNGGTAGADIQALDAWELTVGTTSTVVGVIDTGIDYTHPDLLFNIWIHQDEIPPDLRDQLHDVEGDGRITFRDLNSPVNAAFVQDMNGNGVIDPYDLLNDSRWVTGTDTAGNGFIDDLFGWNFVSNTNDPFDDNGHGTHVAGTIGALGNNSGGVAGVNWNVKLMGLKFLGAGGGGTTANAVAAVNYATLMANRGENIRLTNNSWGGGAFSEALQNAIAASGEADMLFVAAAGNSGRDTDETPYFPASYDLDNVITVAATDRNDQLAWFSNYGSGSVHLGAPGVHIMSTSHGGTYRSLNGTSMAAPHVAGVAALAWSHAPDANYQEIRDAMLAGVDPVEALEGITLSGGRLNARSTLDAFPSDVGDTLATAGPTRLVSPAPGDYYITSNVEIGDGQFGDLDVDVYQLRGIPGSSFTAVTRQPPGADPMNTVLRLFDAQGTELASESGNGYAQLAYTFDTASPYFIAVSGAGNTDYDPAVEGSGSPGQIGHYQLQMGFDVGDTLATAAPTGIVELGDRFVQPNTRLGDGPFGEKDVDLYKLDAIPNSRLTVATSQPFGEEPTSTVLRLFDAEGNELLVDSPVSGYASLEYTFQEAGTYYLGVSGSGNDQYDPHVGGSGSAGDTGHYRLDVSVDIKLEFSRYFGGTGHEDSIMATAVAGHGGVLVTGWTDSVDLPEALNSHHGGTYDAFVANMGPDGTVLWSTYVGGSDWDWAEWIAVDADDNVYVLGITYSNDLPKSTNSSPGGSQNAFAAKLDASGELMWTTYVGGSAFDSGNGIAIDSNNNVLIGGYTSSQDLPNAINEYHGGTRDHFVAKLGNDGSFKWSMYLGGSDVESVGGLAVDHHDNIIFFGSTLSEDLPGAGNSYPGGARSGYLTKIVLDEGGQPSLAWITYWGGSGTDSLTALAIDQHNNFLITGQTRSTDLPEATNGYLSYSGTPFQAFVAKLNGEDGSAMWTTYLGGATGRSESRAVAVDDRDNVFAAGFILGSRDYRAATNRPPGSDSASLVKLDAETGEATWMLYLGGSGWDEASAVAIGPEGQVYVSGYTASPDFTGT